MEKIDDVSPLTVRALAAINVFTRSGSVPVTRRRPVFPGLNCIFGQFLVVVLFLPYKLFSHQDWTIVSP